VACVNEPPNRSGNTLRGDRQIPAVAEIDAFLSELVETTFGPLVVLDARFHVARANAAFLEAFRLTTSETRGKSLFKLGNRQWDIPEVRRLLGEILPQQGVVEGFRVDHDFEALGKRNMLINARRITVDKQRPHIVLLAINDITEREDSDRLLDQVMEHLPAVVFLKSASDLRFVRVNRAAEQFFGYSRSEMIGKNDYDFFPKEQADFFTSVDREVLASGKVRDIAEEPIRTRDGTTHYLRTSKIVLRDADGKPTHLLGAALDITERRAAEEHIRLLMRELDHRVKNVLARIPVIAMCTREGSGSMDEFVKALEGRIQSMASAHELLSLAQWHGVALSDIVHRELAPYATGSNTNVDGAHIVLSAEASQAMAMVLHELVTNAAKYGALSIPGGHVSVRWSREKDATGSDRLLIHWEETGGPLVEAPRHCGYGTSVVRDLIPYEIGGTVDLVFAADGVRCKIGVPFGPKGVRHVDPSTRFGDDAP
jgi:PAS domain S-box-containing protein